MALQRIVGCSKGQTVVEYLLVTAFLYFFFLWMYPALNQALRGVFQRVGQMILFAYY